MCSHWKLECKQHVGHMTRVRRDGGRREGRGKLAREVGMEEKVWYITFLQSSIQGPDCPAVIPLMSSKCIWPCSVFVRSHTVNAF